MKIAKHMVNRTLDGVPFQSKEIPSPIPQYNMDRTPVEYSGGIGGCRIGKSSPMLEEGLQSSLYLFHDPKTVGEPCGLTQSCGGSSSLRVSLLATSHFGRLQSVCLRRMQHSCTVPSLTSLAMPMVAMPKNSSSPWIPPPLSLTIITDASDSG